MSDAARHPEAYEPDEDAADELAREQQRIEMETHWQHDHEIEERRKQLEKDIMFQGVYNTWSALNDLCPLAMGHDIPVDLHRIILLCRSALGYWLDIHGGQDREKEKF